ncbi:hypothetical protein KZA77_000835 [Streptococcus constellatus]|uniref:hypothetical protein n=1 Tax=Streptococcus constellatus TaxID=76860 RepID=UPI001CEC65E0|nr:hypothetical protein [Streptococcus constellatus]
MDNTRDLRFPKQFGDFSESLVMYILGLNNWSVALIDHVGADVIAVRRTGESQRLAISVKGRNFPDTESKSFDFDRNNINKLKDTANMLGMVPAVSFVFVDTQEGIRKIRIIMAELSVLEQIATDAKIDFVNYNSKQGIQVKFTQSLRASHLKNIKQTSNIFYSELVFDSENVFQ